MRTFTLPTNSLRIFHLLTVQKNLQSSHSSIPGDGTPRTCTILIYFPSSLELRWHVTTLNSQQGNVETLYKHDLFAFAVLAHILTANYSIQVWGSPLRSYPLWHWHFWQSTLHETAQLLSLSLLDLAPFARVHRLSQRHWLVNLFFSCVGFFFFFYLKPLTNKLLQHVSQPFSLTLCRIFSTLSNHLLTNARHSKPFSSTIYLPAFYFLPPLLSTNNAHAWLLAFLTFPNYFSTGSTISHPPSLLSTNKAAHAY